MFNKYCWIALALAAGMSHAMAAVDVNVADEAALESITGIGGAKARAIVKEREANGPYKDADDLAVRIDGLGPKSIERLKASGLEIGAAGGGVSHGGGAAGATGVPQTGGTAGTAAHGAAPATPGKLPVRATQTAKK